MIRGEGMINKIEFDSRIIFLKFSFSYFDCFYLKKLSMFKNLQKITQWSSVQSPNSLIITSKWLKLIHLSSDDEWLQSFQGICNSATKDKRNEKNKADR